MNAFVLALALLSPASAKVVRLRGSTSTVVLALALLAPASAKVVRLRGSTSTDEFAAWKAKYAKHYATPAAEQAARTAFLARSEAIAAHNAGGHTYEVGHNQFSDLTPEQFRDTMLGGIPTSARNTSRLEQHVIPADFDFAAGGALDWVAKGAVTGVKNQGQCGSCWAFSTTGAMEGALFAATGSLLSLSEEQLVQCDSSSYGCNGGFPPSGALSFVASNGGVCAESDYAYTSGSGQTGSCRRNACASVMTVEGSVAAQGEQAMLSALQQRPLSILIDAEDCNFQSYRGGIIDNYQCGSRQDHAVLLVGYGTENGVDYWKVKNSWASSWGENGYFRVVRNKNMLGLGSGATYAKGARLTGSRVDQVRVREQPVRALGPGPVRDGGRLRKVVRPNPERVQVGLLVRHVLRATCYENPYGYFHDKASCDGYCGSAPTTKKYACANDQCVESASGAYADVASCEAACGSPGPSVMKYACDAATKTCALAPGGAFWAKADCESSCGSPEPSTKYACSNGQCCSTPPGPTPSTCAWKADTGLVGVNAFITTVADEAACCQMCHLSTKCEAVSFISGACYGFTAGFSLSAGLPGISAAVL
ncbi:transferase [Aureococcus anophagefferens]|nr:transferase [Aureococcus anophagefferens]